MPTSDPRVLIVEADDVLRVMLFTILRHQPLAVDTAPSTEEAMHKVNSCDYALILIDMTVNGAEQFLRDYRDRDRETSTFIIAVRDPSREQMIDPQIVSAVLSKPLELDTLAEVVRECAFVVPPPEDPLPCPQPESEVLYADLGERYLN